MLKKAVFLFMLSSCTAIVPPATYKYKEVETRDFNIATWQKITNPQGVYKFYIEGDGHAFNSHGMPTNNPTPNGTLVRELAFNDKTPNVIYLARPCQYTQDKICRKRHWSRARFAPEIINAEYDVVKKIAGDNPVILVGFSGGAQIAGLISTAKSGLKVKKIITIAGNLDHFAWIRYQQLPPLNESLSLDAYKNEFSKIPQIHYVGTEDKVIPPKLVKDFVGKDKKVIEVEGASHNFGWEAVYPNIWNEK